MLKLRWLAVDCTGRIVLTLDLLGLLAVVMFVCSFVCLVFWFALLCFTVCFCLLRGRLL